MKEIESDDEINIFEEGISILFNEPEVNSGSPGSIIPVAFPAFPLIHLKVPEVLAVNSKLFASHIWKASIYMCRILIENLFDISVLHKNVLELGAGTGLPSILSAFCGARNIVASDYPDPKLLLNLRRNLENALSNTKYGDKWHVLGHAWGHVGDDLVSQQNLSESQKFDIIILADTIWMSGQHDNLLADLRRLLTTTGEAILVSGLHSGIDTFNLFFHRARSQGFLVQKLACLQVPIGHGLGESTKWEQLKEFFVLSDDSLERQRYLFAHKLTFNTSRES